MGWFGFGSKKQAQPPIIKRVYAAASKNRLLSDFFESSRSADSELRPVIKTLRDRSRELARNNEYVKRYLNLLKTNVVGDRGFSLQVKATNRSGGLDDKGNDAVEAAFRLWGRKGNCTADGRLTWVDAQKLAIESLARDGEVFIYLHRGPNFHDSFAMEFIEPDQIDEQKNERLKNGNEIRMGVEVDRFKRPVAYWVLHNHPGDYDYASNAVKEKHKRVPADRMMHIFLPLRAGQTRGEPWMASAMPAMKQLQGYREAAIINARIGASKMGIITTPTGDGYIGDDYENDVPIMDVEPGVIQQLAVGQDFKTFDPAYPHGEFAEFHKAVLKGIASSFGVSYNALSNDLEATSYSSIRQGALDERDHYRDLQQFLCDHFVRAIYGRWLESAMEINSFGLPVRQWERFFDAAHFRGRTWAWVDPLKDSQAAIMGVKAGVISLQDVAAQYGKDIEELFAQIRRDKELAEAYGIQYALEPYGVEKTDAPVGNNSDSDIEDQDEEQDDGQPQ